MVPEKGNVIRYIHRLDVKLVLKEQINAFVNQCVMISVKKASI